MYYYLDAQQQDILKNRGKNAKQPTDVSAFHLFYYVPFSLHAFISLPISVNKDIHNMYNFVPNYCIQ